MSALAQPPWGPNPAKPEFTIQRSRSRRVSGICWVHWALQWHSCPGMLLHDTQGAWAPGISWTGRPITASSPPYQTRSCQWESVQEQPKDQRGNSRLLAAPAAQDHSVGETPLSSPISLWPQTKCSVQSHQAEPTGLMTHRNNRLNKYTTSSLSVHLSMDTGCFRILAIVNTAAVSMGGMNLFEIWYIYTTEYYSATKKNEIMPSAVTWVDLEITLLSEISQRKTNTIWYDLCVESKKKDINELIYKKHIEYKAVVTKGKVEAGIN